MLEFKLCSNFNRTYRSIRLVLFEDCLLYFAFQIIIYDYSSYMSNFREQFGISMQKMKKLDKKRGEIGIVRNNIPG
ncbi:hypothetical protein L1987_32123 [Smallanthus sonchifolius]|uniref:Uncharacterized protein n=1 Tax=Smallanthus sonchifolius TaxID=185202 RepID=A0ACB9I835_9ASTR|nr:hypothetical protein L1987_32123 [Smallanthus sonchifolius]